MPRTGTRWHACTRASASALGATSERQGRADDVIDAVPPVTGRPAGSVRSLTDSP